jgi:hypothetical protein
VTGINAHLQEVRRFGPFAPDPRVTRILDSLKSGQCAFLPPARVTGDLNAVARSFKMDRTGPWGRDFGNTAVWMPDRRRAIYSGANKRKPHHLNDVWEYDLPSNTWICLYGPDIETNWKLKDQSRLADEVVLDDRVVRHRRGGPAIHGQAWQHLIYDSRHGVALFMNIYPTQSEWIKKHYVETGKHAHHPPLWKFAPRERKWEPVRSAGSRPPCPMGSYFAFVPELRRSLWICNTNYGSGVWSYDSAAANWSPRGEVRTKYGRLNTRMPAYNGVVTHCPDRRLILICASGPKKGQGRTWHYDIDSGSWELAVDGGTCPAGSPAGTVLKYDPVSRRALFYDGRGAPAITEYDPDGRRWKRLAPAGPELSNGKRAIAYYDAARNVFVVNCGTKTWVYRHRKRNG